MRLYLIRHAHAPPGDVDATRPLSERGRQTTAQIASWFRHNGNLRPGQVWHSPLVRAYETAVVLEAGLELDVPLVETDGLQPGDDPLVMASRLAAYPTVHDIALVGHEPHLSGLATLLVRGRANPVGFHLRKSAIICLRLSDKVHGRTKLPRWRVAWHFSPELLGAE